MVYQWKKSSYIKTDANIAGQMCEELTKTVGLTAKTLLDANRGEDDPLHNEFEWDDGIASELYREGQARHIINCLCVCPEVESKKEETVRAFFKVENTEYEHIDVILSVQDKYEALLKQAKAELNVFQRKYASLKELQPLFDVIKELGA